MATDAPVRRYAAYFAPAHGTPWERFGATWLGRSAASEAVVTQRSVPGIPPETFRELTAEPRRYGFHATLKAPIRLAADASIDDFLARLHDVCRRLGPVPLGPMRVARLGGFLALLPAGDPGRIGHVAATLTRELDDFRAPPSIGELARRVAAGLTPSQLANLERWGYPHVFADYRFHMTLTGPLEGADAHTVERVREAAELDVETLDELPLVLDTVSVFEQADLDRPFVETHRVPMGAGGR